MRLPNLLETTRGRWTAFFLLYLTEGLPLGFAATAVAAQLRRQGLGPAEVGAFVGVFYLPWALKWIAGPFVDVLRSRRFGHRRGWILGTHFAMVATLLAFMPLQLPADIEAFTAILFVHSFAAAVQDVAIDSLAVNTLREDERGAANGLMFAGASLGSALGGSGVLFLVARGIALPQACGVLAIAIGLVTLTVVLPMKEPPAEPAQPGPAAGWRAATAQARAFAGRALLAFTGSRAAFRGLAFVLLPGGALSLALALGTSLSVELGMKDDDIAGLQLWASLLSGAGMVAGGWLSDRFDRRWMLGIFFAAMSLPVLYLMAVLHSAGYVMPRAPGGEPLPALIAHLWGATLAYAVVLGFMYGARGAILMDITDPRVAATQFTLYTGMVNLSIALAATWQGAAVQAWGYPATLAADALVGLLCIGLLPSLGPGGAAGDGEASQRVRRLAQVLGFACLAWLAYFPAHEAFGKAQPIVGTFFTLAFVAAALFLLAVREVLREGSWRAPALWIAPCLLAMHGRYSLAKLDGLPLLHAAAQALLLLVPLAAGVLLLRLGFPRRSPVSC